MFTMTVHTLEHAQILFDTLNREIARQLHEVNDDTTTERALLTDLFIAAHVTLTAAKENQS